MNILNQSIQLNGQTIKEINNVISTDSSIALFDSYTGQKIVDLAPSHGQVVTIKSGGTGTTKELAPSLKISFTILYQMYPIMNHRQMK